MSGSSGGGSSSGGGGREYSNNETKSHLQARIIINPGFFSTPRKQRHPLLSSNIRDALYMPSHTTQNPPEYSKPIAAMNCQTAVRLSNSRANYNKPS
jgi:hypothetical protein